MISQADKQALEIAADAAGDYALVRTRNDVAQLSVVYPTKAHVKRYARIGERVYHKTKSGWSRVRSLEA